MEIILMYNLGTLMTLEPCSPIDVGCDLEINNRWEVSHNGESLTTCLEVNDY
jgi:hypothetical protein